MVDRFVLLDSSVLINILASKHVEEVLNTLTAGAGVCTAVVSEALYLLGERPADPRTKVSLRPLIERGLLNEHAVQTEEERTLYVDLAADLDDGEAMTLAIAYERRIITAADDKKARRIAKARFGNDLCLLGTADIMNGWAHGQDETKVRDVLRRIEVVAQFRPPNDDPLLRWWLNATAQS
jgi:predicted nucleic acid-binding protein